MYICNKCGNRDKFIGHAEEKGNATIYQHESSNDKNLYVNDRVLPGLLNADADLKNISPYSKYHDYSWLYNISDSSWKGHFSIKKCYYCFSEDISFI